MGKSLFRNLILGLAALASGPAVYAADTDLFAAVPPTGADAPHLLIVMDTGAAFNANSSGTEKCGIDSSGNVTVGATVPAGAVTSLSTKNGGIEQCALYTVIKSLVASTTTVNIGFMMFNKGQQTYNPTTDAFSTTDCTPATPTRGGCLMLPIVPLNATTQPRILEWIRKWESETKYNIQAPSDRGDGATMQEAWAYFFGQRGISGRSYSAITPAAGCANKYVVFLGNAFEQQASPKDTTNSASSPKLAFEGNYTVNTNVNATPTTTTAQRAPITDTRNFVCGSTAKTATVSTDENKGAYALNWAKYMRAQGVTTFTVGYVGDLCDATYVAHMDKIGTPEIGGGKFFSSNNYAELVAAFKNILSEIQSVNSVFAAVSLPVSVNTQGSYLNQVFVGMFRPHKNFLPRWDGNLKQYKLGLVSGQVRLLDAGNARAINNLTGFITECARAFWTPAAVNTYWANEPAGGCLTVTSSDQSDYPDGNIVEKGAHAYSLRATNPESRKVYTCSTAMGSCTTLTSFDTSNTTVTTSVPTTTGTTVTDLVDWVRGRNIENTLSMGTATTVFRADGHGDVVHSRPVPLDHSASVGSPSVVVYYGANDGMLRAVNGNRTASIGSGTNTFAAGAEMWAFMPTEFYGKIKRVKSNGDNLPSDAISYPGSPLTGATPKDYGVDGPITGYQGTLGGSTKSAIFATLRRGGRAIYAMNVTTPWAPELLWKRGCPNEGTDTDCSSTAGGSFAQIGQTWSSLKSMQSFYHGTTQPLLIFGGGYDACEDGDDGVKNHACLSASTKGNRIFVVDANDGNIIKQFPTDRAVVADVTLVRDDSNNVIFGYTADLGGNVYRLDFKNDAPADWKITKIAALGCSTPVCPDALKNRKFFFAPSVATSDTISVANTAAVYYILIGSGDREKPVKEYLASKTVENYFFQFKDIPGNATHYDSEVANCGIGYKLVCMNSLFPIDFNKVSGQDDTPTAAELASKPKGWRLAMESTEQVVTQAITIFGVVTFSTHQPAVTQANSCVNNLGTTRVYNISYLDAASANKTGLRFEDVAGDGLPPSPVAGRVTLDDGSTVPFCIGCAKDSPLEGSPPLSLSTVSQPKGRLYWYIEKQ
jgi:type IV pilus assembly protein PilY1